MEAIHKDDLCTLCEQLLYDPIVTTCQHLFCKSCMEEHALGSLPDPAILFDVDTIPANNLQIANLLNVLVARCPVCHTKSGPGVTPSPEKCTELRTKYPIAYAEREAKAAHAEPGSGGDGGVQTITVCIGNSHQAVPIPQGSSETKREHKWAIFAKSSSDDVIAYVRFSIPGMGFYPAHAPPFRVAGSGSNTFSAKVTVVLKAGYIWDSEHAEDTTGGGYKRAVIAQWDMDFGSYGGKGSMGLWRLKFKPGTRESEEASQE
ncbi:hypothetical protein PG997_010746 [Apiospora hydei]|uniref:RING-type domain-containing protein n=1 Tax=Apiospora hydei TaxID=1337664 RepID=A0ABR1VH26_9PEZI